MPVKAMAHPSGAAIHAKIHAMRTMPVSDSTARIAARVAQRVSGADALLVTAGAGMSADSGLPVFRGNEGFWRAYPPLRDLGISFERMAQPYWFAEQPRMAWAFYGHRLQLYRGTAPHAGYDILRRWAAAMPCGSFIVTSNVDGHFQQAGFPPQSVAEHHGSIHRLQCTVPCSDDTWETPPLDLRIDLGALEARGELPRCPRCGAIARPNILMFNDADWVRGVTQQQGREFDAWLAGVRGRRVLILELGAGTAIPTIRRLGERAAERPRTTLVRINPQDLGDDGDTVVLPLGALQALTMIDAKRPAKAGVRRATQATQLRLARLDEFRLADLRSGTVQTFDPFLLSESEEETCMQHWFAAQRAAAPLPQIRHYAAPGYTMSGGLLASQATRSGRSPGGALFWINGPGGERISTVAMARRAQDGARLWQNLNEQASIAIRPLDCPREPWIGRRLEPGHVRHAAMLATLFALECAIAVSWLKYHALHEWRPGA